MKAPKLPTKIYFTILDVGSGYVYTPSLDDNGGTEYIRKDALMEWLQLLYEEYSERSKAGEMVHQIAGTYLEVINHINEM